MGIIRNSDITQLTLFGPFSCDVTNETNRDRFIDF
jgi:hypothetical protein